MIMIAYWQAGQIFDEIRDFFADRISVKDNHSSGCKIMSKSMLDSFQRKLVWEIGMLEARSAVQAVQVLTHFVRRKLQSDTSLKANQTKIV